MADIDFVIGAKNTSSGPINQASESLEKLGSTSQRTAAIADKASQKINVSFGDLAKFAGVVGAVDAAIGLAGKAISGAIGSFGAANDAYDKQAESVAKLEAAIQRSGQAFDGQSKKLQDAAAALQELTGVGDEVTLGLMRQASVLGVHASQLDDVASAAIGLSEATGKSLEESMQLATDATQGNFDAFRGLIPEIERAITVEQKLAMVQAYATRGLDEKAAASNRLVGMEERAAGAIGDLSERIGALLAPVRLLIASGIKALAETLDGMLAGAAERATSMLENMEPVLDAIRTAVGVMGQAVGTVVGIMADIFTDFFDVQITSAENIFSSFADRIVDGVVWLANAWIAQWTAIETVYNNFGKIVEMAVSSALLQYERLRADTEHLFTVAIPAYATWFADNFFNIIDDVANSVVNVISNMGKVIGNHVMTIWDFIRSGMKGGIGGLMNDLADNVARGMDAMIDGFEFKTESLPDIMARKLTDREQELQDKIGRIGTELGDEFAEKFESRAIKLGDKVGKTITAELDLEFDPKFKKTDTKELKSKESRLLTRGSVQDRQEELLNLAKRQARALDNLVKSSLGTQEATESMAGAPPYRVEVVQ